MEDEFNLGELKRTSGENRAYFNNLFIDGVFVLGKGYVVLDVLPFQSVLQSANLRGYSISNDHVWVCGNEHELPLLWILVNELSEKYIWNNIELSSYLGSFYRTLSE